MSPMGAVHFTFSLVALASGGTVAFMPKGTRWHRTIGHLYVTSMIGVVATSFAMFGLFGRPGPFHFAALVSAVTVGAGMVSVLFRRPRKGWMDAHANWMAWSYVGLWAAAISETATHLVMPILAPRIEGSLWGLFWTLVGVGTALTVGVGVFLIKRRLPQAIAGVRSKRAGSQPVG